MHATRQLFAQLCKTAKFSPSNIKFSTALLPEFGDFASHEELYNLSITNPDKFWGPLARNRLRWIRPFAEVQKCDMKNGEFAWFLDGQLNISGICFL